MLEEAFSGTGAVPVAAKKEAKKGFFGGGSTKASKAEKEAEEAARQAALSNVGRPASIKVGLGPEEGC